MAQSEIVGKVLRNQLGTVYNRSGHALDQCPMHALEQISTFSGYQTYVEDFLTYGGDPDGASGDTIVDGWLLGDINAAALTVDASTQFGALKMATAGADGDTVFLMRPGGQWKYVVGKRMWFFIKFNITDVDDMAVACGLFADQTTEAAIDTYAEVIALDDGIFFDKAEAETKFSFHTRKNDAATEDVGASSTVTDATDIILGFAVDSSGNITAYSGTTLENLAVGATRAAGVATIPDDVSLSLLFGFENGTGADAEDMTVDWIMLAQER